jgi:hypothetical protein
MAECPTARDFSLGKAKIRRNPDGFQEFLTPHSGKRSAAWAF